MDKQTLGTREVRQNLSEIIMQAAFGNTATVVTHHGRPYAAIVPIEVADKIRRMNDEDTTT